MVTTGSFSSDLRLARVRTSYEGGRLARIQVTVECAHRQKILGIIQAPFGFRAVLESPIPFGLQPELAAVQPQTIGSSAVERGDCTSAGFAAHVERPSALSVAVIIAVRAQRIQLDLNPRSRADQSEG